MTTVDVRDKSTDHSPSGRLGYLDGWRGLAILTVLFGHFGPLSAAGNFGVEIFFVLSGRLMAQILVVERFPLPDFFFRRFSRIYTTMFVYAVVMMIFLIFTQHFAPQLSKGTFWDFLSAITFTINYRVALYGDISVFAHLWSISVEEHCYALLAIICFLTRRRRMLTVGVVAFIAIVAMANGLRLYMVGHGGVHETYWRTDVRLASVFSSFSIYLMTREMRPLPTATLFASVSIAAVIFLTAVPLPLRFTVGTLLLAYGVNLLDHVHDRLKRALAVPLLASVGIWSYSIYVWQQPFYMAQNYIYKALGPLEIVEKVGVSIVIPCAICVGLLSFFFLENPTRRWLNAKWKSRHFAKQQPIRARRSAAAARRG